jgi:hypothetical protein
MTQERYVVDIVKRAGMNLSKSVGTPLSVTEKLSSIEGEVLGSEDATKYRSVVGAL